MSNNIETIRLGHFLRDMRASLRKRRAPLARRKRIATLERLERRVVLSATAIELSEIALRASIPADLPVFPNGLGHARAGVRDAIMQIRSQRSQEPVFPAGFVTESTVPIQPTTAESHSLIGLDDFRSDVRFNGIDGSGYAAVILDTGIDLDHPFFGPDDDSNGVSDRIVFSYDFADDDPDATDVSGHGSNVSSIVASSDPSLTGMAPGADIIHLKVFTDAGEGDFGMVEEALQWVVANASTYNVASVNMSLGDTQNHSTTRQLYGIDDELAALAAMDVLVASSSGNSFFTFGSSQGAGYPAADVNSLSVGAVYDSSSGSFGYGSGAIAHSSGPGRITPFSQRHETLTSIMAPGAPITGAGPSGNTVTQHGTSQASPHIAGIAVLAQQVAEQTIGRRLSLSEFEMALQSSGSTITDGDDEDDNVTNTGLTFPLVDVVGLAETITQLESVSFAWQPLGPFGATNGQVENVSPGDEVVGAIHAVLAHPSDADVLYVGGTNGGVWKTSNATAASPSWTPLTDQMPSQSIGAMAFDLADTGLQTVYAGVGRFSSFARRGNARIGLMRTVDGGATWSVVDGGGTLTGKNISGVYANGQTIVVSVNTADVYSASNLGIFRSDDGGVTFSRVSVGDGSTSSGLPAGTSYDLFADPTDVNTIYTSVAFSDQLGGGQVGIYKSVDAGATWTKVSDSAMDALIDNGTSNRTGTSNLEIAVGYHDNVYVSIINGGRVEGLFRSGNGGASWTQMETPTTNENGTDVGLNPGGGKGPTADAAPEEIAGGQGAIHFSILADPTDANIVYVGGDRQPLEFQFPTSIGARDYSGRLFRGDASEPIGSQWVHLTHSSSLGAAGGGTANSSAPHADSRDMVFDANGNIVEVDDGGIYRRTLPRSDQGDWFSVIGDLQVTEIHDIAFDAISGVAIAGNQDTGTTQQSSSGDATWFSISTADGGDVVVDEVSLAGVGRSIRYSSNQNLGSFRRRTYDSSGNLLSTVSPSLTVVSGEAFDGAFRTPVELNVVNPDRLIIQGDNATYETFDQGSTIRQLNVTGGTSSGNTGTSQNAVIAGGYLQGSPNEDVLWVGAGSSLLHRSASGADLSLSPAAPPVSQIRDLTVDPDAWTTVALIDSDEVQFSDDAGNSWTELTGNLLTYASELRSIGFVPGVGFDALVVGTNLGVYTTSLASPGNWFPLGTDLPNVLVYDMEVDLGADLLIAGTLGRGSWLLDDITSVVGETLGTTVSIAAINSNSFEGNAGQSSFTFTVTREGRLGEAATVDYSVGGNGVSPADVSDFGGSFPSGTVSFASGEDSKTISIEVTGDVAIEADEGFSVTLSNPSGDMTIGIGTAVGTILNDDSSVTLSPPSVSQAEGDSGSTPFQYTVTRSGFLDEPFSLDYAVTGSGSDPADGSDFSGTLPAGTVNFIAGQSELLLEVFVNGDTAVEPDEQFTLTLSNPSAGVQLLTAEAFGTIENDDTELSIAATNAVLPEGDVGTLAFSFTLIRSGVLSAASSVDYSVSGSDVDAADFGGTLPSGTVNFSIDESSKVINIGVRGDGDVEPDESFTVTLSNASSGTAIATASAVGTILNDDASLSIESTQSVRAEGDVAQTAFLFTVIRNGNSDGTQSVDYTVVGDGATPADAADFGGAFPSGTVNFADGQSSRQITIHVSSDSVVEADEGFAVVLSNPSGSVPILSGTALGTIENDDVSLSITSIDASLPEGDSGTTDFVFQVSRSGFLDVVTTVDYAVSGTGTNASDVNDFGGSFPSGTLSFSSGESTLPLLISVSGDTEIELDETFSVTLSSPSGSATLETSNAIGTIENDDQSVGVVAVIGTASEGNLHAFRVERTGDTSSSVSVDYAVVGSGNRAADAGDFGGSFPSGTVTLTPGQAAQLVTFSSSEDAVAEHDEGFQFTLSNVTGGIGLGTSFANGTILNDDGALPESAPLDINDDGAVDASTDGNLILSVLFGLPTANLSRFKGSTSLSEEELEDRIEALVASNTLDANEDGRVDASTDGNLIQVVLFGLPAQNMTPFRGATSLTNEQIRQNILNLMVAPDVSADAADSGHVTHVDVPLGVFNEEQMSAWESVLPNSSLSSKTPVPEEDGSHESNILTFVVDFKEPGQANTTDIFGNVVTTFDYGAYGFQASERQLLFDAIIDEIDFDYFGIPSAGTAIPSGQDFEVDFIIGDIGTAPPGVSEYYFVQVGTGTSGPHTDGTLGVAGGDVVRNRFGFGPSLAIDVGDVVSSVFTDAIRTLGGLSPSNALSSGNILATTHAIAGTLAHEIGHTLSLDHINKANVTTPNDLPPVMGTGAVDLPNNDRIHDREFSVSGQNDQNGGTTQTHVAQLVDSIGTHAAGDSWATSVSIQATSENRSEGDSGATNFTFTVTRSGDLDKVTNVAYSVSGSGSDPASSSDFVGGSPSGYVTFLDGETSTTLVIPVRGDQTLEPDEQFTVQLTEVSAGGTTITSSAIGTILNDDAGMVSIALVEPSVFEGDGDSQAFEISLTRTGNLSEIATVDYSVGGNGVSPADVSDFGGSFPSGTVSFASGEDSKTISIEVTGDVAIEADEGFSVTLSNPSGDMTIGIGTAVGTILNDDSSVTLSPPSVSQAEGDSGSTPFQYTVTRSGFLDEPFSLDYAVTGSGSDPADGSDFSGTLPAGTVNFIAGQSELLLEVFVNGDTAVEPDEQFTLTLSNPSAGVQLLTAEAFGTIENDDTELSIAATNAVLPEGDVGTLAFSFTLIRSGVLSAASSVDYSVSGSDVDAADFGGTLPSGTVNFSIDESSKVINIGVRGDGDVEPDESFTVTLSNASSGTAIATASAVGTILNDDASLSIESTQSVRAEGDVAQTAFLFTVIRNGNSDGTQSVDYTVVGDGATPADAADFGGAFPSGTVNFADGQSSRQITIHVSSDSVVEADEGFAVVLSNPSGSVPILSGTALGTIENDDVSLSITSIDASLPEGDSGTTDFVFQVSRSGFLDVVTTVDYAVSGTGTNASDVNDFGGSFPSGTLSFSSGESTLPLLISVSGDTEIELDETFSVTLSSPSGSATLETSNAIGTIENDDQSVGVVAVIGTASEGNLHAFRVERTGDTSSSVSVDYAVVGSGNRAADAGDFGGSFPSGTVTLTPGQAAQLVTFSSSEDAVAEHDEGFQFTLSNVTGGIGLGTSFANGTILNDDGALPESAPLDINDDGAVDASTDGNLILSVLFGLPTANLSRFKGSTSLSEEELEDRIEALVASNTLDANEDGRVDASTDGNLIQVVLFGLPAQNMTPFRGATSLTNEQIRDTIVRLFDVNSPPPPAHDLQGDLNGTDSVGDDSANDIFGESQFSFSAVQFTASPISKRYDPGPEGDVFGRPDPSSLVLESDAIDQVVTEIDDLISPLLDDSIYQRDEIDA